MDLQVFYNAVVLGIIEGITEFLPVSSTGHMLLADHFFGFKNEGGIFEVVIQFGAILAVVVVYFSRLWKVVLELPSKKEARYFVLTILAAFLPSMVIGVLLHSFIKRVLFASPELIAVMLIVGGAIILAVEKTPKWHKISNPEQLPLKTAVGIGLFQCVAMIPGVSRSGATIIGGMLLGVSRKAAAEFSFFLSIPTMFAAAAYDLYKGYHDLSMQELQGIGVGFVVAFVSALIVVRGFIGFITRFGLMPFAWYRILAGVAILVLLGLGH